MEKRERIGLVVLVVLLVILGTALVMVFKRPTGPVHKPEDSIFVKQRMINIQKSKK